MPTYLTFAIILPLCGFAALTVVTAANAYVQIASAPGDARPGDGAVHGHLHGRHADRGARCSAGSPSTSAPAGRWSAAARLTALGTVVAAAVFARRQGVVVTPHLRPRPHVAVAGAAGF